MSRVLFGSLNDPMVDISSVGDYPEIDFVFALLLQMNKHRHKLRSNGYKYVVFGMKYHVMIATTFRMT